MNRILRACTFLTASSLLIGGLAAGDKVEPTPLSGTEQLTIAEPLHEVMVAGINKFALRALAESPNEREAHWRRDYTSPEAYEKSISQNRERLRTIIGAVDPRAPIVDIEVIASVGPQPLRMIETKEFTVIPVRWQVMEGVTAEGILLHPESNRPRARVIALPDADWTPEEFAGLTPQSEYKWAIPLRLVRNECQVLIPTLISRDDTFSGNPQIAMTNQPHREFVNRMAFEMGRHIIGYEVQKVLAAVDALTALNQANSTDLPIGVLGVGEGGLLALHSAALDPRIDAAVVSGYFQQREGVWEEPIYRNIWAQLTEFGDAEIASLIAPRPLIVEACAVPEVKGPPEPTQGRRGGAAPGKITTAPLESVKAEFERAKAHYDKLNVGSKIVLTGPTGAGKPGGDGTLTRLLNALGIEVLNPPDGLPRPEVKRHIDERARQKRQFDELVEFTQELLAWSARKRDQFWSKANRESVDKWTESAEFYRNYVWEEMIGKLPAPTIPPNVRTRKIIDAPEYAAYDVVLDVYPDVIASGVLILPKNMKEGEKRPVVVCQHGLEGTPMSTIMGKDGTDKSYDYYKSFSVELAKQGFITYAPQNPYIGKDDFRTIQRKSNPMKRSLFSYIIRQHERTLEWIASLPNVDPTRIAFYGLSYGGKTAVRVPPILKQYCLSICSADFDEWIVKNVTNAAPYSYVFTGEYEMVEWNMGHTANYAELSTLMTPRPFMVERGHNDGVAPDEWVAWEYAKVRRHYAQIGLGDRTEIEFFNGPHSINGVGTYAFLKKHLNWPPQDGSAAPAK